MEAVELDIQLEELETRVERLRSLYEQYFLGIEKIPPSIAQKDVDRRLYALRREQIRNTARRFKLQTIIQRYNTFQQYWMRIMREIENGTYRRHVLRAERTVGVTNLLTAGERKRLALPERPVEAVPTPKDRSEAEPTPKDGSEAAPLSVAAEVGTSSELRPAAAATATRATVSTHAARSQMERELGRLLDEELDDLDTRGLFESGHELDDPLVSSMPPPPQARKPSAKPVARRSARPIAAPHGRLPPPAPLPQRLPTLESDERAVPTPSSSATATTAPRSQISPAPTSSQPMRRSMRPSRMGIGSGGPAAPGGLKSPAMSAVAGRGLPPLPKPGAPRGAPPKIPSSPIISLEGKQPQSPRTDPGTPALKSRFAEGATPEKVPSPTPVLPLGESRVRQPSVPDGLPHPSESVIPRPVQPALRTAISKSQRPEAAQKPAAPFRVKPPSPAASLESRADTASATALDRGRVEQLAEKLRDARKQTHESATVSLDALAKKLEATADELRKKHVGKRVDFDVIIKDGKAILKPIVR